MGRRFITRKEIDDLAARGETRLEVDERTTVTDVARERARECGISIVATGAATAPAPAGASAAVSVSTGAGDDQRLRAAVRSAVLAAVGETPVGLDAALDRVLGQRPAP